jgi:hypothetical protein
MLKVVVSGVLHPGNIVYFSDFINNLNIQTFNYFDLLIINEGIDESLLNIKFNKGTLIFKKSKGMDPKKNRDQMFESLRKLKYDVNILTDLDDLMSDDRVYESVISIMENKSDICYNDLVPFTDPQKISINDRYWSNRECFNNQKPNIKHNVFGLGNTALSSRIASLDIKVNNNVVYDWEYFLKVYSLSKYIISKSNGYTFYRQINNILGISELDKKKIDEIKMNKIFILNQVRDKYPFVKQEILKTKNKTYEKINKPYWFEL